jgi:hypothetical protein
MKERIDYWYGGTRHPLSLSAYALALIATHEDGRSAAITLALRNFLGSPDQIIAAQAFIAAHEGMNLSLLIEIAISRHFDR